MGYIGFSLIRRAIASACSNEIGALYQKLYNPPLKYFAIYKREIDNPCVDMPLLKAINKQIEELGWLDE